ncbi:MAG: hypothetical protein JAZ17_26990 [Candidatus Thiodiazotropha endolucinida]|nr:hypothetical protein [Candidatus Thiodiazotropha endolucinida]
MKDWFPLTSYDFYSYLACGMVFLFGLDYWYSGGVYLLREWTVLQGVLAVALSYIIGQIIAIPASMILEHWLVRSVLRAPAKLLLSEDQSRLEGFIEKYFIGRHYSPLPKNVISRIYIRAEEETGLSHEDLRTDVNEVFAPALVNARKITEIRDRIDFFRNQYSFSRNVSFSAFLVFLLMSDSYFRSGVESSLGGMLFTFLISFGMLIRFIKFYSCSAAEVLRNYMK